MNLSPDEIERYARHLVLPDIGGSGQQKLKSARVLVIGAGGLGAPLLQYIAAAGVGTIGIVDDDLVTLSNLQRQVIHGSDTIGQLKTKSAQSALMRLNPQISIEPHSLRLNEKMREKLLRAMISLQTDQIISQHDISLQTAAFMKPNRL